MLDKKLEEQKTIYIHRHNQVFDRLNVSIYLPMV